jgi:hypothetical protein
VTEFFDSNPALQAAFQGGIAPFAVAFIVATALARTRFAWLAIVAAYATQVALSTGFSFTPMSASRKILLLSLMAPVMGIAAYALEARGRSIAYALAALAALTAIWVFWAVLQQREGASAWMTGTGIAVFAAALVALMLSLRGDPLRAAAAGVGLGLATGIVALMSASVGFMTSGISVAAGAGALLLVNAFQREPPPPGFLGTLTIGVMIALFAEGALMLAKLPWYALAALLLVPLAVHLPVREASPPVTRAAILFACALVAALVPIAAVWVAPGG